MQTTVMTFAAALAAAKEIPLETVDFDNLKVALTEAEIDFPSNLGRSKLMAKALEHGVSIPKIGGGTIATGEDREEGEVEAAEAETTEEVKKSRNVVPEKYRKKYGSAQNCGDQVAAELAKVTKDKDGTVNLKAIAAVCEANGIDPARWSTLNPGMQRMNLGNVLRGKIGKGEKVVIGDTVWEAEDKSKDDGKTASKL